MEKYIVKILEAIQKAWEWTLWKVAQATYCPQWVFGTCLQRQWHKQHMKLIRWLYLCHRRRLLRMLKVAELEQEMEAMHGKD